jgi:hypothetical protein
MIVASFWLITRRQCSKCNRDAAIGRRLSILRAWFYGEQAWRGCRILRTIVEGWSVANLFDGLSLENQEDGHPHCLIVALRIFVGELRRRQWL